MRFLHTSDLHIGKVVNGFSMLEEQEHALAQIVTMAKEKHVDAVFLCGDLYDRSVPSAQAVTLLDGFLTELVRMRILVFAIAGNHDCGERVGFASQILKKQGLHICGSLTDPVTYVDFEGCDRPVRIHLMPYEKPVQVKELFGKGGESYEASVRETMNHVEYGQGANILLAHHFVVNQGKEPEVCDSETRVSVGGTDQVDVSNFCKFDYVALGHIHGRQQMGDKQVYYSGSPVKYSFSEAYHKKGVIYGEIDGDGHVRTEVLPLTPVHEMRKIRGKLSTLISQEVVEEADANDYILAILTDEEELIDPIGILRSVYPNIMQMQIEKRERLVTEIVTYADQLKEKSPSELFEDFYKEVTGDVLNDRQKEVVTEAIQQAKEEAS